MALREDLIGFVKEGLHRGLPRAQLEDALTRAGWPADQVRRAMASFAEIDFPIPVPRPVPQTSSREAFMYVVMFATLVLSAYNLGSLLFNIIDRAFPDPAQTVRSTDQGIRWSLATLIVAFPVFVSVAWLIGRAVRLDPIKRTSRVRRQLTYLTLGLAAFVLIGDFISVVYNFLGGELTIRFVLKVVTVGAIAGAVFGYYLWDLRSDETEPDT